MKTEEDEPVYESPTKRSGFDRPKVHSQPLTDDREKESLARFLSKTLLEKVLTDFVFVIGDQTYNQEYEAHMSKLQNARRSIENSATKHAQSTP